MTLFRRQAPPGATETRSTVRLPGYLFDVPTTSAGVAVSGDAAYGSSAVWACIRLLAGTGSMLPVDVVRYIGDSRQPVEPRPTIVARPSVTVPAAGWRYQAIASWLTDGNVYARVTETTADMRMIVRAEILDPASVTWRQVGGGMIAPHIGGVRQELWPTGDLWHVPGYLKPGSPVGMSPIGYAAESIGANIAARKFGAQFFGDGGHPTTLLAPDTDPGIEGARALKERWVSATRGNREPIVVPKSTTVHQLQVSPTDSQFIESQRFSIEDICRFFGVPPEMIGAASSGSSVTYANREQRSQDFLTYGLDPWLIRLEDMLTEQIPRPQICKINRAAVLRNDTLARYAAHEIAMRNGWRSVNETRRLEDEPPIEGGDTYAGLTAAPQEVPAP